MFEQHPTLIDSDIYPKVHIHMCNLEQKAHIICGHWTKLSIVPSTHGKLPSPKKRIAERKILAMDAQKSQQILR